MKEDEIQPLDVISNKKLIFTVCQNSKQAVGTVQNRYFDIGEVLKENLI